jgi:hypothetical protein
MDQKWRVASSKPMLNDRWINLRADRRFSASWCGCPACAGFGLGRQPSDLHWHSASVVQQLIPHCGLSGEVAAIL